MYMKQLNLAEDNNIFHWQCMIQSLKKFRHLICSTESLNFKQTAVWRIYGECWIVVLYKSVKKMK